MKPRARCGVDELYAVLCGLHVYISLIFAQSVCDVGLQLCSSRLPAETHEERGGQRPRLAPSPETDNDDHHRRRSAGAPSLPLLILDENTWNSELCSLRWMWIGLDVVCTIISLHSSGTTVDVMAGQSQRMFGESFCRPSVSAVTELIRACDLWSIQFFRVSCSEKALNSSTSPCCEPEAGGRSSALQPETLELFQFLKD
ncbi:hypothetical protein MHYP_G00061680 [Metynnis hypsauchen]